MLVVNLEMIDGSKVQEAVIFEKSEKEGKVIQDFSDLKFHFGGLLRMDGKIHYKTRFMSGSIMANSIANYEVKRIESNYYV